MDDDCAAGRICVARDGVCTIERCLCGTIHVTLGALTLRLTEDAFESLSELLGEAVGRLRKIDGDAKRRAHTKTLCS